MNLCIRYSCLLSDTIVTYAERTGLQGLFSRNQFWFWSTELKRILAVIIAGFALFAQSYAQDIEVTAQFYNKTMYYPGSAEDNPVYVHVTVANKGPETLRFKLADDRMFSMDFKVLTVKNKELPATDKLIRKRTMQQTIYFREISLETGEEYSFT